MKKNCLMGMAVLMIMAVVLLGCSDRVGDMEIKNAPEAVGNLQAKVYPGSILLTWTLSMDADGYEIFRTDSNGTVEHRHTADPDHIWFLDQVHFVNNKMINDENYTYTVVSVNKNAGGNISKATVTAKANIPIPGSNITSSFPNTSDDVDVVFFNPIFDTTPQIDAIATSALITIKNLSPAFNYNVSLYQRTSAWSTNETLNLTEGTALLAPTSFNPFNEGPVSGKRMEDTRTFLVTFGATTFNPSDFHRVILRYTSRIPEYKITMETLSPPLPANFLIWNKPSM